MGVGLGKSVASNCVNEKMLNRLFGRAVGFGNVVKNVFAAKHRVR